MENLKANMIKWTTATCIILISGACIVTVTLSVKPLLFK